MNRIDNPYSPAAGSPPPELVGRDGLREDVAISIARLRSRRLGWLATVVLLGWGMEWLQARGNHVGIEWVDVQMDWFGTGLGCSMIWLLPVNAPRGR
jgi:hypothetical protein